MNAPDPLPPGLRELLRCPVSGARLRFLGEDEIERVAVARRTGALRALEAGADLAPFTHGLVCEGGEICYPVRDGVPYLVREEGFMLPGPAV